MHFLFHAHTLIYTILCRWPFAKHAYGQSDKSEKGHTPPSTTTTSTVTTTKYPFKGQKPLCSTNTEIQNYASNDHVHAMKCPIAQGTDVGLFFFGISLPREARM